jgi:hypothetical protein
LCRISPLTKVSATYTWALILAEALAIVQERGGDVREELPVLLDPALWAKVGACLTGTTRLVVPIHLPLLSASMATHWHS